MTSLTFLLFKEPALDTDLNTTNHRQLNKSNRLATRPLHDAYHNQQVSDTLHYRIAVQHHRQSIYLLGGLAM
jgi:hypothetical protein